MCNSHMATVQKGDQSAPPPQNLILQTRTQSAPLSIFIVIISAQMRRGKAVPKWPHSFTYMHCSFIYNVCVYVCVRECTLLFHPLLMFSRCCLLQLLPLLFGEGSRGLEDLGSLGSAHGLLGSGWALSHSCPQFLSKLIVFNQSAPNPQPQNYLFKFQSAVTCTPKKHNFCGMIYFLYGINIVLLLQ